MKEYDYRKLESLLDSMSSDTGPKTMLEEFIHYLKHYIREAEEEGAVYAAKNTRIFAIKLQKLLEDQWT